MCVLQLAFHGFAHNWVCRYKNNSSKMKMQFSTFDTYKCNLKCTRTSTRARPTVYHMFALSYFMHIFFSITIYFTFSEYFFFRLLSIQFRSCYLHIENTLIIVCTVAFYIWWTCATFICNRNHVKIMFYILFNHLNETIFTFDWLFLFLRIVRSVSRGLLPERMQ